MSTENGNPKRQRDDQRIHVDTRLDPKADDQLLQEIWELKRKPKKGEPKRISYTQTFRDAFNLILSLRRHDTTVLYQMFPWLREEMPNQAQLNNVLNPLVRRLLEDPFISDETDYHYNDAIE